MFVYHWFIVLLFCLLLNIDNKIVVIEITVVIPTVLVQYLLNSTHWLYKMYPKRLHSVITFFGLCKFNIDKKFGQKSTLLTERKESIEEISLILLAVPIFASVKLYICKKTLKKVSTITQGPLPISCSFWTLNSYLVLSLNVTYQGSVKKNSLD